MNKNVLRTILTSNFLTTYLATQNMSRRSKSGSSDSYVTGSGQRNNPVHIGATSAESLPKVDYDIVAIVDPSTKVTHENIKMIAPDVAEFIEKLQSLFSAEMDKTYNEQNKEFLQLKSLKENLDKVYSLGFYPYATGKDEKTGKTLFDIGDIDFTVDDIKNNRNLFQENIDEINATYPDLEDKKKDAFDRYTKYSKYSVFFGISKNLEKKYYDALNEHGMYVNLKHRLEKLKEFAEKFEKLTPDDVKNIVQVFNDYEQTGLGVADISNDYRNCKNDLSRLFHCKTSYESVNQCVQNAEKKMLESLSPEEKMQYENIEKLIVELFKALPDEELAKLPTRTTDLFEDINKDTYVQNILYLAAIEELEKTKSTEKFKYVKKSNSSDELQPDQKESDSQGFTCE